MFLLSSMFTLLVGCPTDTNVSVGGPPPRGPEGAAGGPPTGPGGNEGGPAHLTLDLTAMKPTQTQAELMTADHLVASGSIKGGCVGNVSIHALTAAGAVPGGGPYTVFDTKGSEFSMALPRGTAVFLIPHCDVDGDGKIDMSLGDAIGGRVDVPASSTDMTGLVLDLTTAPMGPPPMGAPPSDGAVGGRPPGPMEPGGAPGGAGGPAGGGPVPGEGPAGANGPTDAAPPPR